MAEQADDDVSLWCVILDEAGEKAVQVRTDDAGAVVWLPRSQITLMPGSYQLGSVVLIRITEWIATRKGLI